ncbi:MAG: hypothetical protein J3K34DRAFT_422029 [Monoraphidium minutum]|nr:MAG: hypothetical protein J3K34DRAFT_422029 [Monoraphidium minutum]
MYCTVGGSKLGQRYSGAQPLIGGASANQLLCCAPRRGLRRARRRLVRALHQVWSAVVKSMYTRAAGRRRGQKQRIYAAAAAAAAAAAGRRRSRGAPPRGGGSSLGHTSQPPHARPRRAAPAAFSQPGGAGRLSPRLERRAAVDAVHRRSVEVPAAEHIQERPARRPQPAAGALRLRLAAERLAGLLLFPLLLLLRLHESGVRVRVRGAAALLLLQDLAAPPRKPRHHQRNSHQHEAHGARHDSCRSARVARPPERSSGERCTRSRCAPRCAWQGPQHTILRYLSKSL